MIKIKTKILSHCMTDSVTLKSLINNSLLQLRCNTTMTDINFSVVLQSFKNIMSETINYLETNNEIDLKSICDGG